MRTIKINGKQNKLFDMTPPRLILLSFLSIIILGTILLSTPLASQTGERTPILIALFTATSATCVTGLVAVDTGTHWSLFGQIVILLLFQFGALGLITLATSFTVFLGKKISLQGKRLAVESTNHFSYQGILSLVRKVILITLIAQFIGTILLSFRFVPKFGLRGIYLSLFHTVSAFCNAGFDIMGNFTSLTRFNQDPYVLFVISLLIITGGLGFIVWDNLIDYKKTKILYLHTKIVLILSLILIFIGGLLFFILEHSNPLTIGELSTSNQITSSMFQSVTTRTAGFNSIEISDMTDASKMLTIILMFIGAGPGSTAGGIKITTFAIILIAIFSEIRGLHKTVIFNQKITRTIVFKALAIIGLAGFLITIVTASLLLIENNYPFIDLLFEATSAFGTVGLSSISTPNLTNLSRLIITFMMFIGRIGPLTFAISIALRKKKHADKIYPEGKVMVG